MLITRPDQNEKKSMKEQEKWFDVLIARANEARNRFVETASWYHLTLQHSAFKGIDASSECQLNRERVFGFYSKEIRDKKIRKVKKMVWLLQIPITLIVSLRDLWIVGWRNIWIQLEGLFSGTWDFNGFLEIKKEYRYFFGYSWPSWWLHEILVIF